MVVVFGLDLLVEAVDFEVVVVRGLLEELLATVVFGLLVVLDEVVFGLLEDDEDVVGCS